MALGSFATVGVAKPRNLDIVVIDNHHFGETGMQASHTGHGIDLENIAAACGFAEVQTLDSTSEVEALGGRLRSAKQGPGLFVIKVAANNPPRSLPSRDAVYIKSRFRAYLGLPSS